MSNKTDVVERKNTAADIKKIGEKVQASCSGGPHTGTVGYELRCLNNLVHRCIHNKNSEGFGKSASEVHFWIIGYLKNHCGQEVFQRDLEAEFEVRRSTMTGILQTMEKNGLILRESVEYDARLKKLVLTDKALRILTEKFNKINEFEAALVQGVSEDELKCFFSTIEKIKSNLMKIQEEEI
ncbi:MAG: MarR family winged helix-turn-helix transcriptional regulator [Bacillota bacterium]|jgi:DNA-binding MarR family transcriptional regulator